MTEIKSLRDIPSVEELTALYLAESTLSLVPRPQVVLAAQAVLRELRESIQKRQEEGVTLAHLHERLANRLQRETTGKLTRVINATGILIHTNLGRAPLAKAIWEEIEPLVSGYCNLEYDVNEGGRGDRGAICETYLATLTGAEAATIANNNAAALLLLLNTFANKRQVIISRGELLQIGGGFRIPDLLARSGAKLAEVGTTNVTNVADYESAISKQTAMILRIHQSNFSQSGFTEAVSNTELATLAEKHGLLFVNDLGSGALVSTKPFARREEQMAQQSVRDQADLTCFSGDKLLGGPQAGLIVGRRELIGKLKKNPLFRALRVDKISFAILEHVLAAYLNGTHVDQIPIWRMLSVPESELYKRAKQIVKQAGDPAGVSVEATEATLGGGTSPDAIVPSVAIIFGRSFSAAKLHKKFRTLATPIIGRVLEDRFYLDLKVVDPSDDPLLVESIRTALS